MSGSSSRSLHLCIMSDREISINPRNWGGMQTHTKNLVSLLLQEGHSASLITKDGEEINEGPIGFNVALHARAAA